MRYMGAAKDDTIEKLESAIAIVEKHHAELIARIKELEDALEPFACKDCMLRQDGTVVHFHIYSNGDIDAVGQCTIGDFLHAAEVMGRKS